MSMKKFLSTPSARRATACRCTMFRERKFLSTPSARRATVQFFFRAGDHVISIHALREEGDVGVGTHIVQVQLISIHALREEGDAITSRSRGA